MKLAQNISRSSGGYPLFGCVIDQHFIETYNLINTIYTSCRRHSLEGYLETYKGKVIGHKSLKLKYVVTELPTINLELMHGYDSFLGKARLFVVNKRVSFQLVVGVCWAEKTLDFSKLLHKTIVLKRSRETL